MRSPWSVPSFDGLAVAGRTDAGVHALGQVASADVTGGPPVEHAAEALNTRLPDEISVVAAEPAAPDFQPRATPRSRAATATGSSTGARRLRSRRAAWWLSRALDDERLAAAAALLSGEHDFRAFTPTETQHRAAVSAAPSSAQSGIAAATTSTSRSPRTAFFRRRVRSLVGTMFGLEAAEIAPLLAGRERSDAGSNRAAVGALPRVRRLLLSLVVEAEPTAGIQCRGPGLTASWPRAPRHRSQA